MAGQLAAGPKKDRKQFGDRALGDTTAGFERNDPRKFPATGWDVHIAKGAAPDAPSPSEGERVRGEMDLKRGRG